jgi:hypothetical protein
MTSEHCESALHRIQRIITNASRPDAPITEREAYEQIVEELELAGFGAPFLDGQAVVAAADARLH